MINTSPQTMALRDGRNVCVRDATPADAEVTLAYHRAVLAEVRRFIRTEPDEFEQSEEGQRQWIASRDPELGDQYLIALVEEGVVGALQVHRGRRRKIAHIGYLAMTVRLTWQGLGVGSALMAGAIDRAEACPALVKLDLEVYSHNPRAIQLYERFGFQRAGVQPKEAQIDPGEYVDSILMYRWVKSMP